MGSSTQHMRMGNTNSFKQKFSDQEISRFSDETGFTVSQLTRLYERFEKLDLDNKGYLEREDLLSLPELNVNPLSDRIIHAFFTESQSVKDSEKMQFQDFIMSWLISCQLAASQREIN